ncbi:MAG: GNAT family N-acetyltransferase [Myxococcota bacterium]|nr:GNAT family N-acetyltransferase [Myxococcota bacterium]MEE2778921.1 GNAT family N-acetyltransferase [Myxococcota bacterium]
MNYRIVDGAAGAERDAAYALRFRVFVDEQKVPEDEELDDIDEVAWHVVLLTDDGRAIATGRAIMRGDIGKMQRIAVDADCRGLGLGRVVMDRLEDWARDQGATIARLEGQVQAIPFYEKLGYVPYGEVYMDCDIPHRWMDKELK